jgi:serine/threonine protein kinase
LKPENVFLRWPTGQSATWGLPEVVLADFGCSQLASVTNGTSGTKGWESPEVHRIWRLRKDNPEEYMRKRHEKNIMSTASDIYQLGLVMYTCLSYKFWPMFGDPRSLRLPKGYTSGRLNLLVEVVAWCLSIEPADRPTGVQECDNGANACC